MVVLTNEHLPSKAMKLVRRCVRCRREQWLSCYEHQFARRCNDCISAKGQNACRSCGEPAGWTTSSELRMYCVKPECIAQRERDKVKRSQASRRRNFRESLRNRKTWVCPVCNVRKPLDFEHFAPHMRDENGEIARFDSYCRPCRAVDQRLRYQADEDLRARANAKHRERYTQIRARRDVDPEYDAMWRERSRLAARRSRANRKLRAAQEQELQAQMSKSSGQGPEMPAGPLMTAIDAWIEREEMTDLAAAECLGVSDRRLREWRQGGNTRMSIVDKALIAMDMLWWEVWSPDEYPEVAKIWEGEA